MTSAEMAALVRSIEYKDWQFYIGETRDATLYLQIRFIAGDSADREAQLSLQHGRKWLLSQFMTPGEVVQTALKAVLTAEEHEARERFRFHGEAIFNPHLDLRAMLALAGQTERRANVEGS